MGGWGGGGGERASALLILFYLLQRSVWVYKHVLMNKCGKKIKHRRLPERLIKHSPWSPTAIICQKHANPGETVYSNWQDVAYLTW